jgi:hypothetical protein
MAPYDRVLRHASTGQSDGEDAKPTARGAVGNANLEICRRFARPTAREAKEVENEEKD